MRIDHLAIWSRDIAKLREFYITYFEASSNPEYQNTATGFSSYFLSFESGCRLELMQMSEIPENANDTEKQYLGLIHLAFTIGSKSAVVSLTERLRKDGYKVVGEPRLTGDGYFESCILDPDRNRVEICGDLISD